MQPYIEPISFPDFGFRGDIFITDIRGKFLDSVERIIVEPIQGIAADLGDPLGRRRGRIVVSPERLTITVQILETARKGKRQLWLESSSGSSNILTLMVKK
jgi:hypothetical protein